MVAIARIVKAALKYDTVVARAFRRALGISARPKPVPAEEQAPGPREGGTDREIIECFKNKGRSPVEWG